MASTIQITQRCCPKEYQGSISDQAAYPDSKQIDFSSGMGNEVQNDSTNEQDTEHNRRAYAWGLTNVTKSI